MSTISTPAVPSASTQPAKPKLVHLQILRACAASLVVADHTIGALSFRNVPVSQYQPAAESVGQAGVFAFLVLSGFIMMRQSYDRFGLQRSSLSFAYHRVTRIVPLYWIATILWVANQIYWSSSIPHLRVRLLLSPALLLIVPGIRLLGAPYTLGARDWYLSLGIFSVVMVAASALAVCPEPGWSNRSLILLADASYSTYLFHIWVYEWSIPAVVRVYAHLHRQASLPAYTLLSVVAANLPGLAVYFAVERPLLLVARRVGQAFSGSGTLLPASSTSKLST